MPAILRAAAHPTVEVLEVAQRIRSSGARRLLVTGNGAAHYVGLALWAMSLRRSATTVEVVSVPAGFLSGGWVRWQDGDLLLVVSSSGELRDVVELLEGSVPVPVLAITATPGSPIGRAASARITIPVADQEATTHTQAYVGNLAAAGALWAELTDDDGLRSELGSLPERCHEGLEAAPAWVDEQVSALAVPAAGITYASGPGWPAAMEAALLLKEVANIPCEGLETREGATSGMYALGPTHLAVSIPVRGDQLIEEAERVCARTGAATLRLPGSVDVDPDIAPVTSFPYALALAAHLGRRQGLDVDEPPWAAAYYRTARTEDPDAPNGER